MGGCGMGTVDSARAQALAARQSGEMRHDLVDIHHIDVFMMQIPQIDLVGERGAVEGALLDERDMEATSTTTGDGLIGGAGDESGAILSGGTIGSVVIKGDLIGGVGAGSGAISSVGNFGSLTLLSAASRARGRFRIGAIRSESRSRPNGTKSIGGIEGGAGGSKRVRLQRWQHEW